jgi:hypothetical protein
MKDTVKQADLFKKERRRPTTFSIEPGLWKAFQRRAEAQDLAASLVLRQMIRKYIDENQQLDLVPRDRNR